MAGLRVVSTEKATLSSGVRGAMADRCRSHIMSPLFEQLWMMASPQHPYQVQRRLMIGNSCGIRASRYPTSLTLYGRCLGGIWTPPQRVAIIRIWVAGLVGIVTKRH